MVDQNISQKEVFELAAKPIVNSCLEGYNGSIFAYGQTGAGKTFTIQGPAMTGIDSEQRGLLPRCFEHLFSAIKVRKTFDEMANLQG